MPGRFSNPAEWNSDQGRAQAQLSEATDGLSVLIASRDTTVRRMFSSLIADTGVDVELVSTVAQALDALEAAASIVIVDESLPDGGAADILPHAFESNPSVATLVITDDLTVDSVVEAMRLGARDVIARPIDEREAQTCVLSALRAALRAKRDAYELYRLRRAGNRLASQHSQTAEQINVVCNDAGSTFTGSSEQVRDMSLSSEFTAVIQQELDIEELLRKGLEFMLTRTGPTNAAVYLPTNHCDFSLGAYVNYDCPKETADVLLDHLADVVPGRFQDNETAVWLATPAAIERAIEDSVGWLDDVGMVVYPCRQDGECLAVLVYFRDEQRPFTPETIEQIETMGELFGEQLARVIRVHHRRLTDTEEFSWDFEEDDADEGFGGGLAA